MEPNRRPDEAPESATVLLAEDDPALLRALEGALREAGYQVVPERDGAEAVRLLAERPPGLVVTDILLPGASGFQVVRAAREGGSPHVPVLVMSGTGSPAHRAYAEVLGADGFLVKPFAPAELVREAVRLCPPARSAAVNGGRVDTAGRGW